MATPSGTPPGKYSCRLNMMSVQNPDDDFAEGPQITFELTGIIKPPPPPSRAWLFWVLLGLFVIGGTVAALFLMKKPRLQAAFEQSATKGFAPLTVKFTNLTTGKFESTLWNFGDGAVATNRDSEHTFDRPGTYIVMLLVDGPKGQAFATNAVAVVQRASAQFQASPDGGPAPLAVKFVNQSTGDDLTWSWDFGNGQTSTEREPPAQTYSASGNYTVRLVATGPQLGGESNVASKAAVVRAATRSQADFKANQTRGETPLNVRFTDTSAGNPTSWRWEFGDGTFSSERNPTHTYTAVRNYNVTLSVSGPGGAATVPRNNFIVVQEAIRIVPNLFGIKLPDALNKIKAAGLTVGTVKTLPLGTANNVISQDPPAGTRARPGDKVDLTVWNK